MLNTTTSDRRHFFAHNDCGIYDFRPRCQILSTAGNAGEPHWVAECDLTLLTLLASSNQVRMLVVDLAHRDAGF